MHCHLYINLSITMLIAMYSAAFKKLVRVTMSMHNFFYYINIPLGLTCIALSPCAAIPLCVHGSSINPSASTLPYIVVVFCWLQEPIMKWTDIKLVMPGQAPNRCT